MTTIQSLSDTEHADLVAALDDEYRARAAYAQVLADFGAVPPFTDIVESERRHIAALARLFVRYGVPLPVDTWQHRTEHYASVCDACEARIAAETGHADRYERLLAGTAHPDIRAVYRDLQEASQHHRLPAFRRCVERGRHPVAAGAHVDRSGRR